MVRWISAISWADRKKVKELDYKKEIINRAESGSGENPPAPIPPDVRNLGPEKGDAGRTGIKNAGTCRLKHDYDLSGPIGRGTGAGT